MTHERPMRTRNTHWPTRSPMQEQQRAATEHLLSERALRERIEEISARAAEPAQFLEELDEAIRESRIS